MITLSRPLTVALVLFVLFVSSMACESPSGNQIDGFTTQELQLQSFNVSPDTLDLFDSDSQIITTNVSLEAVFESVDRLNFPVYAYIQDVVSSEIYASYSIPSRFVDGDSLQFDTELDLPRAGLLELSVILQAPIVNGQQLRAEKKVLAVSRENNPPEIVELVYPDTAFIPAQGQNPVGFFARATDPQGLNDISGIYMDIFNKDDLSPQGQLILLDNGLEANGDQLARDGIFTAVVGLTPTSTPRTFVLNFYALDRQGASSDTTITEFTTVR